jgi:RHS repeat-associated protein
LGTPQLVSNNIAATVWTNTYQPYGQGGIPISAIVNNLRLPGQNYDLETGFHYNLNRDYMPNIGRYLESDPIGLAGGLNPYRYANANPGKFTDRRGLDDTFNQGEEAMGRAFDAQIIVPLNDLNYIETGDLTNALGAIGDYQSNLGTFLEFVEVPELAIPLYIGGYMCQLTSSAMKNDSAEDELNSVKQGMDIGRYIKDLLVPKVP